MKHTVIIIFILFSLCIPVNAMEFTPPEAPAIASPYMPEDTESFSDGLWFIIKSSIEVINPSLAEGARCCLCVVCVVMITCLSSRFTNNTHQIIEIIGIVAVGVILFEPTNALIQLGTDTIHEVNEYGKALLPVMTAAYAAEGSLSGSASLYIATTLFNTILTSAISSFMIPMIFVFLSLSVASHVIGDESLNKMKDFFKGFMTWTLKIILYIFTGYVSITGVVSGTVDASAIRAAKITISGMVPVVGSILSDASETVLISAGIMKNTAGIYGLLVILACCLAPFLRIGLQYLVIKVTSGVISIFGSKNMVSFIHDFSGALGLLLGAAASVCFLLIISTFCFMKGFK